MEQSSQIGEVWSFYKAMSDRAEMFPFIKCFPPGVLSKLGNLRVLYGAVFANWWGMELL